MTRFRFRLQPVLDQRQRVVDACQRELAVKERERAQAQAVAAQVERDRERHRATLTGEHAQFDAETLRATYAHLAYLDRTLEEQLVRVAACEAEAVRAQAKLWEANIDRKVLDTLKDRRLEAFAADAALVEQREVDDQNARRYGRAQNERSPDVR